MGPAVMLAKTSVLEMAKDMHHVELRLRAYVEKAWVLIQKLP
jgi:hypothetical protein